MPLINKSTGTISAKTQGLQCNVRSRPIPVAKTTPWGPYKLFIHPAIGSLAVLITENYEIAMLNQN